MIRYVLVRGALLIAGLLVSSLLIFLTLRVFPGDVAQLIAGTQASPAEVQALRESLGLDRPLPAQYLDWMGGLLRGDLGTSQLSGASVGEELLLKAQVTVPLGIMSLVIAVLIAVPFGILAALQRGRRSGTALGVGAQALAAVPVVWAGMMLIVVFSVWLDWLPVGGMAQVEAGLTGLAYAGDVARHLVLPALTLGLYYLAVYTRLTRAAMLEAYAQDYVRTAIAKGVRPGRIARRHVLRNALLPIVTQLGLQLGAILGGAVLVETVFAWPGLGRLAFEALFQRDLNLLLGILLCSSVVVVLANLAVDFAYAALDPRTVRS